MDPARLPGLDASADARGPASYLSYPLRREGERFPFVSGDARGFSVGVPQDEADEHRAALEGVAFLERFALERVQTLGIEVRGPFVTRRAAAAAAPCGAGFGPPCSTGRCVSPNGPKPRSALPCSQLLAPCTPVSWRAWQR